jgi:formate hydrogenlyase subunit 6/NADH:ubiquinone oxidoreductase subunit I
MQNATDVYQRLARHLDDLPGGFPRTDSGVEFRILRRLFSPDEAALAPHVSLIPEAARVIAMRAGIGRDEAGRRLADMARKGLIVEVPREAGPVRYAATQFVIGIWEFHLNDLDPVLVADFEEYLPTLAPEALKFPQLRTIPVNRSLSPQLNVLSYECAEELIEKAKKLLVAACICRRERRIAGTGCSAPEEACLVFDTGADIYESNGWGRPIERREAHEILARADDAGLVLQPGNSRTPTNICCCCGCCCGVLRSIRSYPKPAAAVSSAFIAALDADSCSGCGTCVSRCQMQALRLDEGKAALSRDRCIGCGLCVSTCPTDSLVLQRRPASEQPKVPKDGVRAAIRLAREQGKLSVAGLALKVVQSKVDRLRALR